MSLLSKELAAGLLGSEWSFGYNCYEVGHTWTPYCTDAALEVSVAAGARVLPLYALLYGFGQIVVQRQLDPLSTWETVKSTIRSSSFIAFHVYNGSIIGCALRNGFGRFYYRVLVCMPALASSYLSLLIEKPARRQALAFYLLNLASETLYRMAVTKGHFKPIRHGETLLFALSLAAWYHLIKAHGFGRDPVSAATKLLIGRHEAKLRPHRRGAALEATSIIDESAHQQRDLGGLRTAGRPHRPNNGPQTGDANIHATLVRVHSSVADCANNAIDWLGRNWAGASHASCPHAPQYATCLNYVIAPIPSRFLLGWALQTLLKLASKPLELARRPSSSISRAALSADSTRMGLFLATLVSSGRLVSCLLRRYSNSNEPNWHALVSGLVAGTSMLWAPRSSLSMYVLWKAVEQYFLLAASQNKIAYFDFSILTIYSLSAATLLYTFALEPKLMRPSYMKFLDNLSDHRLHQLNRMVLDVFGTGSSLGYEDYFPDLDPRLMSNQFKELIFNWMIQPYE